MPQTSEEEEKKFAQSQMISEFPNVCGGSISRQLSQHGDTAYDPTDYPYLVNTVSTNIFHNYYRGGCPPFKDEWKLGMEVELEEAWNAELAKIKEDILKRAREKIPRVCRVMVNGYCDDLLYPDLKESEFERFISLLHVGGNLRTFQDSWKEDIRGDIEAAWEAEILKAKADGRIPSSLENAFKLAWAYMERTKPFAHHKWISEEGLRYALINLIMSYPDNLWDTWPDKVLSHELVDNIPTNIIHELKSLYREINARGE